MSDANRESVGYIAEVTFGTNPGGTKQLVNFTSCNLNQTNETKDSNFVRSDTNRAGTIRTGLNSGGSLGIELQYGAYDAFLEAVLRSTFGSALGITGVTTISAAAADNSFNDSGSGFGPVTAGQWIKVSGFATAANNGYFYVVSKTTSKLVVAGGTLVNESATPAITIKGAYMKNGTTKKSFTLERAWEDITKYQVFSGCRVGEVSLNFNTADIASGSINFVGAKQAAASGSSGFSGSTASATTKSMNTVNNIKKIFIDKVVSTSDFTSLDFTISTNSEALKRIGSLEASQIRQGSIAVSGNFGLYFEDTTLLAKGESFTEVDLTIVTEDDDGNAYVWHFPQTFISGTVDNQGIDTTITAAFQFSCVVDPTLVHTISITKMAA